MSSGARADREAIEWLQAFPRSGDSELEPIAYAIMRLALAAEDIAVHLKYLGNGDAATTMGAIEALWANLKPPLDAIADALTERSDRDDLPDPERC